MIARLALRNVLRNRWRAALTASGVAVAVALLVFSNGYFDGFMQMMVQGATTAQTGQAQIHTREWVEDKPSIYEHFALTDELLENVRNTTGVSGVVPRVHFNGLVGHESRSQVARFIGTDPAAELGVTAIGDGLREGRWLSATTSDLPGAREAVIGYRLADQLRVSLGDELVLFAQAADGSLGNELLLIVGIVDSGTTAIDRRTVFMHIDDASWVIALEGRAHELAIATTELDDAQGISDTLNTELLSALSTTPPLNETGELATAVPGTVVPGTADALTADALTAEPATGDALRSQSWLEIQPQLASVMETSRSSIWIMYLIILAIVGLGLFNTQRMTALERRREFGVLLALGLTPRRLAMIVLLEGVLLALLGALCGAALGLAINWHFASAGLDLDAMTGGNGLEMMGISFGDRLYFPLSLVRTLEPVWLVSIMALVCGFVPAWTAARLNAVQAIAGRT